MKLASRRIVFVIGLIITVLLLIGISNIYLWNNNSMSSITTSSSTTTSSTGGRIYFGALFYTWYTGGYGPGGWYNPQVNYVQNCNLSGDMGLEPSLGWYNSANMSVINQQLAWIKYANLDYVALVWDNSTQSNLVAQEFASTGFPFTFQIEQNLEGSASQLQSVANYIYNNYVTKYPNYFTYDGKPVIMPFNSNYDLSDPRFYVISLPNRTFAVHPHYDAMYECDPGYQANNLTIFQSQLERAATPANPSYPIVIIASFNEWHELSGIEPSSSSWVSPMTQNPPVSFWIGNQLYRMQNAQSWGMEDIDFLHSFLPTIDNATVTS